MEPYFKLNPLIILIISVYMGAICAKLARKRGRNPTVWFGIGTLFGILGILTLFIFPSIKKKPKIIIETPPSPQEKFKQKLWYYLDQDEHQIGPMSFSVLESAYLDNKITQQTLVWNEDFEDWKEIKSLELFPDLITT